MAPLDDDEAAPAAPEAANTATLPLGCDLATLRGEVKESIQVSINPKNKRQYYPDYVWAGAILLERHRNGEKIEELAAVLGVEKTQIYVRKKAMLMLGDNILFQKFTEGQIAALDAPSNDAADAKPAKKRRKADGDEAADAELSAAKRKPKTGEYEILEATDVIKRRTDLLVEFLRKKKLLDTLDAVADMLAVHDTKHPLVQMKTMLRQCVDGKINPPGWMRIALAKAFNRKDGHFDAGVCTFMESKKRSREGDAPASAAPEQPATKRKYTKRASTDLPIVKEIPVEAAQAAAAGPADTDAPRPMLLIPLLHSAIPAEVGQQAAFSIQFLMQHRGENGGVTRLGVNLETDDPGVLAGVLQAATAMKAGPGKQQ